MVAGTCSWSCFGGRRQRDGCYGPSFVSVAAVEVVLVTVLLLLRRGTITEATYRRKHLIREGLASRFRG